VARDRGRRPKDSGDHPPARIPPTPDDHSTGHPKFCLRFLQRGFDVANLDRDRRADLALTLQQRSSMTWTELHQAGRHGQGYELIPRHRLTAPIPAVFADRDRFHVFRYSGKLPMAGVRAGDVLHIVWIEARFNELYDHG
jgi:hypothetical protein